MEIIKYGFLYLNCMNKVFLYRNQKDKDRPSYSVLSSEAKGEPGRKFGRGLRDARLEDAVLRSKVYAHDIVDGVFPICAKDIYAEDASFGVLGIASSQLEVQAKLLECARNYAEDVRRRISENTKQPYELVDLTEQD